MMAGVDRISALPEEIKVSILSRLGIREAVHTSALSRSWRHLWTLLPGFEASTRSVRAEIVDHLLSSLRGPIHHFSLLCPTKFQSPQVQNLLDLIVQKEALQMLRVHLWSGKDRLQLPNFRSLKYLSLCRIELNLPIDFCGFDHLTTLHLYAVRISQQDIQLLIDRSKKLTSFYCDRLIPADAESGQPFSVTLNSPLLKYIGFNFWKSAEARVISAPCLKWASVTVRIAEHRTLEESARVAAGILRFLADIAQVSSLSLRPGVLKTLSSVGVLCLLPKTFNKLRCLKLSMSDLAIDKRIFDVFTCLLRSAPFLKELKIRFLDLEPPIPSEHAILLSECMKKQDGFPCLNQSLTSVTIKMIKSDIVTIRWIIRFLLLNANVLKLMTIEYSEGSEVEASMIEELRKVKVTSEDAKLVILSCEDKVKINVR